MRVLLSLTALLSGTLGLATTLGSLPLTHESLSLGHEEALQPTRGASVARRAAPDTLRRTVQAGEPLVMALPDRHDTTGVDHYTLLRGPALCGVAGRSLAWATHSSDAGTHTLLLRPVAGSPLPDTLAVVVRVQ